MQSSRGLGRAVTVALCTVIGITTPSAAHAAGAGDTLLTSGMPIPAGAYAASDSGRDSDGEPGSSSVSADGRYVAFLSDDDTLTPGVDVDVTNLYRKDRVTGAVELISRTTGAGGTGLPTIVSDPVISNDGNRIAWRSSGAFDPADTDERSDVYVRDVAAGTTTLATPGTATDIYSYDLSGDGNWIAFTSSEALGGGTDGNSVDDVYRRNLTTGVIALASATNATTTAGNNGSRRPSISDDGAWVAFSSQATNLVAGYASGGGSTNIFARRMSTNFTALISAKFDNGSTGGNGDSDKAIIAGQPGAATTLRVGFTSRATNLADNAVTDASSNDSAYVRQFAITSSTLVSRANGGGGANANSGAELTGLSDSPLRATFQSSASNLPGGSPSSFYAAYLRDLDAGTTAQLSGGTPYAASSALSGNGNYAVWYEFGATPAFDQSLSGVFGRTVPSGAIELVSRPAGSAPVVAAAPSVRTPEAGARTVSADGRYVVFAALGAELGDQGNQQIYRRDLRTGELLLVSRATGINGAAVARYCDQPAMDASGTRIVFTTGASLDPADTNAFTDVYVRDIAAGTTTLVSRATGADGIVGNTSSLSPTISADGTHVAFTTTATNFGVPGSNNHVYVRDLTAQTTVLADRATGAAGAAANDDSDSAQLSGDGRLVVFSTYSTNLSADDPAAFTSDIYLRDLAAGTTTLLSRRQGLAGAKMTGGTYYPSISSDGSTVAFVSSDEAAVPGSGSWGGNQQIVARTIGTGQNALVSRTAAGVPADEDTTTPSVSADGAVIAFSSDATNLLPGRGGSNRDAVFAKNLTTGALSGPPAFGLAFDWAQQRATYPSISEDGQCMAFVARGHNAITGKAGDFTSAYVHVVSGSCPKPEPSVVVTVTPPGPTPTPAAQLSRVSLTNARFKVGREPTPLTAKAARAGAPKKKVTPTGTTFRFTLNTTATVRIAILRRVTGRKVGKQCLKTNPKRKRLKPCKRFEEVGKLERTAVPGGARSVAFSGRLGTKKLPTGSYQARLVASTSGGSSAPVTVAFTIVRR